MKIKVKVHTNSSQEKIKEIYKKDNEGKDYDFEVWIKEKPIKGEANKVLIKILKKYFKKDIKIVSGFTSNKKIVEII